MKVKAIVPGVFALVKTVSAAQMLEVKFPAADCFDPDVLLDVAECQAQASVNLEASDLGCAAQEAFFVDSAVCSARCDGFVCEDVAPLAIDGLIALQCDAPSVEDFCAQVAENPAAFMTSNNVLVLGALTVAAAYLH